jgi:serine/threonine protein kinase
MNSIFHIRILFLSCFSVLLVLSHRCDDFASFKKEFKSYWDSNGAQSIETIKLAKPLSWRKTKIGQGSSGKIFSTFLEDGDKWKPVAVKYVDISKLMVFLDDTDFESTVSEIEILCSFVGNPHILQIVDFGISSPALLTIVTEEATNDVLTVIENNRLNMESRFRIIETLILAIEDLHERGFIYRDLKWENVLYFRNEAIGMATVKLGDFGLSEMRSRVSNFKGNSYTIAPEVARLQLIKGISIDGKPADIYGLSILISDMLETKFPIIPTMESYQAKKRPTIGEVKTMFLEFKRLHQIMRRKKVYVSEVMHSLSLEEKLLIIDSVINEIAELKESRYMYGDLKWENVLYIKDDQEHLTIKLENFGYEGILSVSEKMKQFAKWRDFKMRLQYNEYKDVGSLMMMIESILNTKLFENSSELTLNDVKTVMENYEFKHTSKEKYSDSTEETEDLNTKKNNSKKNKKRFKCIKQIKNTFKTYCFRWKKTGEYHE